MEIEAIPDTGLFEDDLFYFKIVKKSTKSYYHVKLKNNGGRCPNCGSFIKDVKEYKKKEITHDKDKIIFYYARRFVCKCKKTFYEEDPFTKDETKLSDYVVKRILEELKRYNHTFLEVAQRFNISVTKVVEIFDSHVQIERKTLREVISIDEFYFSRRSKNKYAFMILGLNGEILDILKSRKKSALLDYFKYIPQKERSRVKYVTMDMNETYKEIINRRLKNAVICIDSFHVIKLMNDELDRVRRKVMKKYENNKKSDEYHLLKHKKYVLFKGELNDKYHYSKHFRLDMNETDYLDRLIKIDPELTKTYQEIKRYYYFNDSFNDYTRDEALTYIESFIDDCLSSNNECLIKIASTLDNWKEEIANSFIKYANRNGNITRLSNGKIEGKNSYIKKMLRLANGYSNFKRFRNRAMYCENYYKKYSEEKLPNTIKRTFPKKKTKY